MGKGLFKIIRMIMTDIYYLYLMYHTDQDVGAY